MLQVVFAGFSAESLAGRILDCRPKLLLTCSVFKRGIKLIHLKEIVDDAVKLCLDREHFSPGNELSLMPISLYKSQGLGNRERIERME